MPTPLDHQPFYCEENIWRLCQHPAPGPGERLVALITGPAAADGRPGRCALWHQRAAAPGQAVLWDYHVILLVARPRWQVWDLDTDLDLPLAAGPYLERTFADQQRMPARWRPWFRLMPATDYVATLRSDRSHMRRRDGTYLQPPPWWPPPGTAGSNLARFLDLGDPFIGAITDLAGLRARLELG